jgi:hypothetical protein
MRTNPVVDEIQESMHQAVPSAWLEGSDDQLIAETTPEGILLRPAVTLPLELYSPQRLQEFDAIESELAAVMQRVAD